MTDLIAEAKKIFLAMLDSLDVETTLKQKVKVSGEALIINDERIDLSSCDEIKLVGFGKASLKMGAAVEELLDGRIKQGILVTDRRHELKVKSDVIVAGHPLPDANSLVAGERIVEILKSCGEKTLIIFLISGGGSALVELPISPKITLEDIRTLNRVLVTSGATIREINTVRKKVSQIKGGGLARLAAKSRRIAIYISDVNPGDLRSIASNPLMEDVSPLDAFEILLRHDLIDKLPISIVCAIEVGRGCDSLYPRTEEARECLSLLLLDNRDAILAAANVARRLGCKVEADFNQYECPYQEAAETLISKAMKLHKQHPREKICLIAGGEVACPVRGRGQGGRNQEFVLYSAARLAQLDSQAPIAVLSCGTDGIDGNTDAAGAVASPAMVTSAERHGLTVSGYIDNNDSHSFFRKVGGLVVTGPTGNNVRDIRILLAGPDQAL